VEKLGEDDGSWHQKSFDDDGDKEAETGEDENNDFENEDEHFHNHSHVSSDGFFCEELSTYTYNFSR